MGRCPKTHKGTELLCSLMMLSLNDSRKTTVYEKGLAQCRNSASPVCMWFGDEIPKRGLELRGFGGLKPRARCAGFSVAEIGNRKECLRVREAGASAAGRGQRPYASFPGFLPLNPLRTPSPPLKRAGTPCTRERGLRLGLTALRGASEGWGNRVSGSMRL